MAASEKVDLRGSSEFSDTSKSIWLFVPLIALAMAIQVWAALQGDANLISDEAGFGLLSWDFVDGHWPVYIAGQRHYGSLEPFFSAIAFRLFDPGIFAARTGSLGFYLLFLILNAMLVHRLWGRRVALLCTLVLALPPWSILWWTFRPLSNLGSLLTFGTAALLLLFSEARPGGAFNWRVPAMGMLLGLGLWAQPMIIFYGMILGLLFWMQSPEWQSLSGHLNDFCARRLRISGRTVLQLLIPGIACLLVLIFFTRQWSPQSLFRPLSYLSAGLLFILVLALIAGFLVSSTRRKGLIAGAGLLAAGFVVGNFPQWAGWIWGGIVPELPANASSGGQLLPRAVLVLGEVLPSAWGMPPIYSSDLFDSLWTKAAPERIFWLVVAAVVIAAVISFLWANRKTLVDSLAVMPLAHGQGKVLLLALMFAVPVLCSIISGNTIDLWGTRFLILTWQASAVILALFFLKIMARSKIAGALAIVVVVGAVGLMNIWDLNRRWNISRGDFSRESLQELRRYLAENAATGGYVDFWWADALTFATNRELAFTSYNHRILYPEIAERTEASPVHAYVFFRPEALSTELYKRGDWVTALSKGVGLGPPAHDRFLQSLRRKTIIGHRVISHWDVWLARDSLAVATVSADS